MFYKNARIFAGDFQFRLGAFEVKDGRFGVILPEEVPADAIDLQGATVIPGLVEVHSHGCAGADFSDGDYEGLLAMAAYLAKSGVTSFAPTSMTLPYETLEKAFATASTMASSCAWVMTASFFWACSAFFARHRASCRACKSLSITSLLWSLCHLRHRFTEGIAGSFAGSLGAGENTAAEIGLAGGCI